MNITTSIALIPPPPPPLIEPPSSSQLRPLPTKPSSQHLSVPPGFAPLFPELPIEERNAALLYISHSDATERQARILRVQQSLAPGFVEPTVAKPIISHDLNKGKGHVFVFQENDRPLKRSSTVTDVPGNHERTPLRAHSNSIYDSSDHEASSASSPPGPTGFLMGSSSGNPPSGTRSEGRKNRRRPQRWKRINKPHLHAASGPDKDDSDTGLCSFVREERVTGHGRFVFDKRMLSQAGVADIVKFGWGEDQSEVTTPLVERIRRCRLELSKWKRIMKMGSRGKIARLKVALEKEISKRLPCAVRMTRLKRDLAKAHRDEEAFWRQQSRKLWLKLGDRNTRYFHHCARSRKLRNRILMLRDAEGREQFSEGSKGHIAAETDEVDLSLTVSELIDRRYGTWNVQRVRHLFVEEDANYILGLKIDMNRADAVVWGLERNELLSFSWAIDCLSDLHFGKVVFESSSYLAGEAILRPEMFLGFQDLLAHIRDKLSGFRLWNISYAQLQGNRCAHEIALSVTRNHRGSETSGLAMLLVRACGAETFVPWTLLEREGASCVFMLELIFHSGSSIYSSQWFTCLASHTSRSDSPVAHPSYSFPLSGETDEQK
ncbi:hypothetical protein DY000_02007187 [Brassica cretica]|uniref:RNase H type-1 domain-containing protein n=1 Tax=Brassica cretica TaxID=69181 RepID=A0ABQ7BU23_BRACR|nr:hypothetical protein DY000_02007187 [Brassica cretica]